LVRGGRGVTYHVRPAILIATAVAGVLVALGVVAMLRPSKTTTDGAPPDDTPTGRPPAFHLDATPEQKRTILETSFQKIASDRPERLGTLKDDIALLLDDPEAVRFIVSQWHLRRNEGRYADAAFADVFRLVKNPEFVEPTGELLVSTLPGIRGKGLQAAETQASPKLGPKILAIYRSVAPDTGDAKVQIKLDSLRAAFACKGDSLNALLLEAFQDGSPEVAVQALDIATDLDTPLADVAARRVLASSKDRRVRLHAAALLAKRGDLSAQDEIIAALDPNDQGLASEAAHIVAKQKLAAAAARLREVRPKASGELQRLFLLALLRTGDPDAMQEMILAADTPGGPKEIEGLQLLAASGDVNAAPILLHGIDRGGIDRIHAIANGISTSQEPGLLPVIEKLIEQPVGHPAELGDAPRVGGKALIPRLSKLLSEATEPAAQVRFLAWIAAIGGPEARNAILNERKRIPRFVDEQIRLIDLEARRLGAEAPPLNLK
jgi:hypothetical protein